jgi:hypothetical protein
LLPSSFGRGPPKDGTIIRWLRRFRSLRSQRSIEAIPPASPKESLTTSIIDTFTDAPEVLLFEGIDSEIQVSANDSDVDRFRKRLLEDADLEMLFHPEFDGIESDQSIGAEMNLAYLHPRDWFVPFS